MFCEECGAKLLDDSKFCMKCGNAVMSYQKGQSNSYGTQQVPIEQPEQKESEPVIPMSSVANNQFENQKKQTEGLSAKEIEKNKKSAMNFVFGMGAIILIAFIALIMAVHDDINNATPGSPANAAVSGSSEPEKLTPLQKRMGQIITENVLRDLNNMIIRDYKLPEAAQIKHNKLSWNAENSIFDFSGTITYQNKGGKEETHPFYIKAIISDKNLLGIYEKLGDKVIYNSLDIVNTYGAVLVDEAPQMDLSTLLGGKLFTVNDVEFEKVTLEEFGRIKVGMTYAEVTDIIGSLGTFTGQTGANINTYSWVGNGDKSSKATISFTGKKVKSTSQVGLK